MPQSLLPFLLQETCQHHTNFRIVLFSYGQLELRAGWIPQKTSVEISILGGRFSVGFLEGKTRFRSLFEKKIEKTSLCCFIGMLSRERCWCKMWHKIRQKDGSGFANASCKRTEFFQVHSSEKQTYYTDIKYDAFKQHYERQWDLYGNVTSFKFFSSYYHLEYLQVLPPVPHWNVAQCHKFNSEAIFPDYLTKDLTWTSDYFSY